MCLEFTEYSGGGGPRVSVIASIPGRHGALEYVWGDDRRRLSSAELADLGAVVQQLVTDWIVSFQGSQEVLPLVM